MKLLLTFILSALSMIVFIVKTSHTGHLRGGIMPPEYYKGYADMPIRGICKAVMCNGDTIDYWAASYIRCDELYENLHCIGKGKFLRTNEEMYIYTLNSHKFSEHFTITDFKNSGLPFIWFSNPISINELKRKYNTSNIWFGDEYNCN